MKHLKAFVPSAKADGKERKISRNIFFTVFLFNLPSALADGAEIFEC
jgi:hypothetical protein